MPLHRRHFHLHIHQDSESRTVRWEAARTYWTARQPTSSAVLGSGSVEITAEGGTTHEIALALFRACLAQFEEQIRRPPELEL